MLIFTTKTELENHLSSYRSKSATIGFVPTMGALHQGHLSLVKQSLQNSDLTVVSIFVNPTQFNDPNDLRNYPRNFEADRKMLEEAGCHVVFYPDEKEMYPEPDKRMFNFDGIDTIMEGEHRPGHFNGVAQIVSKLFYTVKPHKAFFGLKDFQQVAIINQMVKAENLHVEIIACPIVREPDGLAMSSRNMLLTPEHRKVAPRIYQTLQSAVEKSRNATITELTNYVIDEINSTNLLKVEYFQMVDNTTLIQAKTTADKNIIGCIAVWAGKVRLIDNIVFNS